MTAATMLVGHRHPTIDDIEQ